MFWIRFTKKNEIALMDLSCITSESLPSIATRLHHPDAAPLDGKDKSAQDFMDIHSAYTTLYNPNSRVDYDCRLMTSMRVRNNGKYL